MKRCGSFAAGLLAVGLLACSAQAAEDGYMSADTYMMASRDERLAYVQGVVETLSDLQRDRQIASTGLVDSLRGAEACMGGRRVAWLEQTFTTWLDDHVERWDEAMSYLVVEALAQGCQSPHSQSAETAE